MKVLYCTKYNYPFSGTESYLFEVIRKVNERGHATALFSMDHHQPSAFRGESYLVPYLNFKDRSASFLKKAGMAAHALYSFDARRRLRECLRLFSPDVSHIRGIYHHLSPSILWELRRRGVPVLYHLNDFKILCPSYNLVSNGKTCERCAKGDFFHMLLEGCYGGPRSSAGVLMLEAYLHKWLKTYERCVDLFLAPSEFVRGKLIGFGFPPGKIVVLPHFQELAPEERLQEDGKYILYFGRLSREKGISDLLRAMSHLRGLPLIVAGDGPERRGLKQMARNLGLSHISFVGTVHGSELEELIAGCRFSVFPSHAYETVGKSILESYAWARPVVASDLGSRREFVDHGLTGLLYPVGDCEQLADAIQFLYLRPEVAKEMGKAARERIRKKHDPERYTDALLEIYSSLATKRAASIFDLAPPQRHRPLRIALIGGRGVLSKYSGIESYYEQVGGELASMGHAVTAYCRTYFTPKMAEYNGMRVVRLWTVRSKYLETLVHTFLSTVHAMFSRYDIVHFHALGPALFSFLPRLTGKKTVVTVQGLDWQRRKWGRLASTVLRLGEAASVVLPDATMVVSKTLQQYYWDKYGRKPAYVPNGATVAPVHAANLLGNWGLEPDDYVLYLGRFSPEKNCHLLVGAFESIMTGTKLVLAGGSSHSDAYAEMLKRHQSEQILILPWVAGEELQQLRANAALFVLPSDLEGLSLALLDAMASGTCVLTSDIPENREVVDGVGFTFRSGDQQDLARMMQLLLGDADMRHESGARGQQRVREEYLWPPISRSIEQAYYEVLGWKGSPEAGCLLPGLASRDHVEAH